MPEHPKYMQQWERVNRLFNRFKIVSEDKVASDSTISDEDDMQSFFLNCYHLKDWIKNDPTSGQMSEIVEDYINNSEALCLCADLCNGLKHLSLDKSRSAQNPRFGKETTRFFFNSDPQTASRGYIVITDTKLIDAYDLAWQCMMDWHNFIYLNSEST